MSIANFLTYPVFKLGDTPTTRKLHHIHEVILRSAKILSIALPALSILYITLGFYIPTKVTFTPSDSSCVFAPSILPGKLDYKPKEYFTLSTPPRLSLFGMPILATHMCVVPTAVPSGSETTLRVSQLGLPMTKSLTIRNNADLSVSPLVKGDSVSTRNNLLFELSEPDLFFDYILVAGDTSTMCRTQGKTVICPTKDLGLKQGEGYRFELKQSLGESTQGLFSKEFVTITSVEITNSSIAELATVYEQPLNLQLTTSKPIKKVGRVTLTNSLGAIETETRILDTGIDIIWPGPLARQQAYTLKIESLDADDGGHLEAPYVLNFTTSGGPKVTQSTLPSVRTSQTPDFELVFDQPINGEQDIASSVQIISGGKPVPASIAVQGDRLRVRVNAALPSCSDYLVTVKETLVSLYGVSGGNAYSNTHRTQCAREFSIGSSVEGRSILGYALGSGPKKVVFLGAIHGNEKSTHYLLNGWLDYLEANPGKIPADATIVVFPKLNPDGFVRNSRFNARNVDLNRNFPSASWKTDVVVPGGSILAGGGGTAPLSEPEAYAIHQYLTNTAPSLVMSYHSQGSITIPNGAGSSATIAREYARAVGYQYVASEASSGVFEHETTGALEDWLYEGPGTPVVLNELSSHGATGLFQYHRDPILRALTY